MLENWSNGRLRATRHRVVRRLNQQRFSIVFFAQPDNDVIIEPLKQLVDEDAEREEPQHGGKTVKKYQACSSYEFMQYMMKRHHGVK